MLNTGIGRLRFVGLLEGTSCLALFGFAMPMKHLAGIEEGIMFPIGMTHGVLFMLYNLVVLHTLISKEISFKWSCIAFVASVLPLGTFIIDHKIKALPKSG